MNLAQAKREAFKRWGKDGWVEQRGSECLIGRLMGRIGLLFREVIGSGSNWAEAFWDADTKYARSEAYREAKGQPCPRCSRSMSTVDAQLSKTLQARAERLKLQLAFAKGEEQVALRKAYYALTLPHSPRMLRVEEEPGFVYICRSCHAKAKTEG